MKGRQPTVVVVCALGLGLGGLVVHLSGGRPAPVRLVVVETAAAAPSGSGAGVTLTIRRVALLKLSGRTGAMLWERPLNPDLVSGAQALEVSLDAMGDVIAGAAAGAEVVKLASGSGRELARYRHPAGGPLDAERSVTVYGSGRVVASGRRGARREDADVTVVKYRNGERLEIWRDRQRRSVRRTRAVTVQGLDGGRAGVGALELTVGSYQAASGREIWRQRIEGASSVTLGENGDVIAVVSPRRLDPFVGIITLVKFEASAAPDPLPVRSAQSVGTSSSLSSEAPGAAPDEPAAVETGPDPVEAEEPADVAGVPDPAPDLEEPSGLEDLEDALADAGGSPPPAQRGLLKNIRTAPSPPTPPEAAAPEEEDPERCTGLCAAETVEVPGLDGVALWGLLALLLLGGAGLLAGRPARA